MQIKTIRGYHLTPVRMAFIKKSTNKCWRECEEKGILLHCWRQCKLVEPLWRTVWRFIKILKTELPYDPAIPFLGIYPEKIVIQKDTYTSFPGGLGDKETTCNAGDTGLIPGSGRSPGEGSGYPLQYSCLENPMDRGAWQATAHRVTKSWTWLSN